MLCIETLSAAARNSSETLRYQIRDGDGNDVPGSVLSTMTITYYDLSTAAIINGRQDQDILGPLKTGINNHGISPTGLVTWYMQPADNPIVTPTVFPGGSFERHRLLVNYTWDPSDGNGVRANSQAVDVLVKNLEVV